MTTTATTVPDARAYHTKHRAMTRVRTDADRNALAMQNTGIAGYAARPFARRAAGLGSAYANRDYEDLFQSAMLVVIDRAADHDPALGTMFSHAADVARTVARRLANTDFPGVRIKPNEGEFLGRYRILSRRLPVGTTHEQILSALGVPESEFGEYAWVFPYLDPEASDETVTVPEDIADPGPGPAETAERNEEIEAARATVARAMASLTEKQRLVLTLRLGLDGGGEREFREIGRAIGNTYQRAHQIYEFARLRIRAVVLAEAAANGPRKGLAS